MAEVVAEAVAETDVEAEARGRGQIRPNSVTFKLKKIQQKNPKKYWTPSASFNRVK